MTDLHSHKNNNANLKKIEEILKKIRKIEVEFIYYIAITLSGRVIAKVVPASHLRRNLENGVNFHRTAMADMQTTRHGVLLGGGATAAEIIALPDIDTFNILPWDKKIASFFCRLYEPAYSLINAGKILPYDCRSHLIMTHEHFTAETGLVLKSGCEPEMSWFGEDIKVHARPGSCTSYDFGHLELMRPVYKKIIGYATAMNFNMIEGDYEDPGQLELNWMYDACHLTADRLIMYRLICRQVAREFGLKASFMPKPNTNLMGNGCHHNISLWDKGENIVMDKSCQQLKLSDKGFNALGGLLKHLPASMLVMGQTVNSYKRFWDTGLFAPYVVNWGVDNKTCSIRVANNRFEYKAPDASVNPYLSHTLLLRAIADGLCNETDAGEAETGDGTYDNTLFERIPLSLGEAIMAFKSSDYVLKSFPAELSETYIKLKEDEWERYCSSVTDWEREMYMDYLP